MSPILKRDIHEQLRYAKRLALAAAGRTSDDQQQHHQHHQDGYEWEAGHGDVSSIIPSNRGLSYASGSNPRQGIGVEDMGGDPGGGSWREQMKAAAALEEEEERVRASASAREEGESSLARPRRSISVWDADASDRDLEHVDDDGRIPEEEERLVKSPYSTAGNSLYPPLSHAVSIGSHSDVSHARREGLHTRSHSLPVDEYRGPASKMIDLRNLLLESTPSLLLLIIALVFTGQLLEHLARWRVFLRVDELFILVPMLGNLKGNLEMCLSARLGTSANIGELDHRRSRKRLLTANLTLLGLQALLISCLAAVVSFVLGLITIHRLGDVPIGQPGHGSGSGSSLDPGLGVGDDSEWHEGYTRPGFKQLMMVLATGMGSAGLSSAILGSFMGSIIVLCRWMGVDPDNITPPVAACLGDLLTLFILALLGSALVGVMDTPIPLIAVLGMAVAAAWFTRKVLQDEWVRKVARGGWTPLIAAMLISSGTGMALEKGVGRYRGFALLAIPMTGLTGSIGAIHANRLSTTLHTGLHPASLHPQPQRSRGLSPNENAWAMYAIAFPCQAAFLGFASWWGWIDFSLGWAGWLCFAVTAGVSICLAQWMTLFFWSKDLDPDSYTLPMHSALVDFLGQCLLMLAYEVCIARGLDVQITEPAR